MNKLEELLRTTQPTEEETKIYRKVEKHYQLNDLKDTLEEYMENGQFTEEEYEMACEHADIIIEKYNKFYGYDWQMVMAEAIRYALEYFEFDTIS